MIQQKKATDRALYERALKAFQNGDETMKPVVDWYRRGKKPKPKGTQWHERAHHKIVELLKDHSVKGLADHIGTYPSLIYRLNKRDYRCVPEPKAKAIAEGDYSRLQVKKQDTKQQWKLYRKAQDKLKSEHKFWVNTYKDIAKKYGLTKGEVSKCIRDYYKNPHQKIIDKVL